MTRRIFPIDDWAPAQEAMYAESSTSAVAPATNGLPPTQTQLREPTDTANEYRARSVSMSLPWRIRPKSMVLGSGRGADEELEARLAELSRQQSRAYSLTNQHHVPGHAYSQSTSSHAWGKQPATGGEASGSTNAGGSLRGIFRRASVSMKGMLHRRTSVTASTTAAPNSSTLFEEPGSSGVTRPGTSHSTWQRIRQATSLRTSRSLYATDLNPNAPPSDPNAPIPGIGGPPIIPRNTGAAAKAAAALQNEYLGLAGSARPSMQQTRLGASSGSSSSHLVGPLHNKWLTPSATSDDGNDRESGIGIAVASTSEFEYLDSDCEASACGVVADEDEDAYLVLPLQDTSGAIISRIDFIARLPVELGIQILANLDATALSTAARVSRRWRTVVSNQHIWRESFLREKTGTYATSGPTRPGLGLGVPTVRPTNDWRQIYRVKEELDKRWKEGKARPVYLNGHLDSIYCLQFDESKIITGSRDKTIRIWDMHTFQCRLVIGPPEVINDVALLLDENGEPIHYATLQDNQKTALSVPATASFPVHHKASILCLQYDDRILVTGSSDASCIVYNVKSAYRPIRRLRHHSAAVLDLAFDDRHIVTCSKDVSICVWDRATGALLRQLRGHSGPVNAVQMRGNTIVSCSGDFRVKLWNIDTGKNIREFVGHTKGLACSQFSEDGRYIASAGNDKVIRIWDANTGECLREMRAHENLVRSLHIDSVSGRLVSGSYDTDIKVWDMETGRQLLDFPKWHQSWVLSAKSDYRRVVSTGQDPKILIMDFGAEVKGIEMLETGYGAEGGYI